MSKEHDLWFHHLAKVASFLIISSVLVLSHSGTQTVYGQDGGIATPIATLQPTFRGTQAAIAVDSYKYDFTIRSNGHNMIVFDANGQEAGILVDGSKVQFIAKANDSLFLKRGNKTVSVKIADLGDKIVDPIKLAALPILDAGTGKLTPPNAPFQYPGPGKVEYNQEGKIQIDDTEYSIGDNLTVLGGIKIPGTVEIGNGYIWLTGTFTGWEDLKLTTADGKQTTTTQLLNIAYRDEKGDIVELKSMDVAPFIAGHGINGVAIPDIKGGTHFVDFEPIGKSDYLKPGDTISIEVFTDIVLTKKEDYDARVKVMDKYLVDSSKYFQYLKSGPIGSEFQGAILIEGTIAVPIDPLDMK